MTTFTSYENASTHVPVTNTSVCGLSLRVLQPGVDEQLVQLPMGKCTVGSSERCQVHLANAQVRPLHCLIVHEATETSVTRWAPGAQLNGQDFATAPLQVGDCLQIADVQMFVVAAELAPAKQEETLAPQPAASVPNHAFAPPAHLAPVATRTNSDTIRGGCESTFYATDTSTHNSVRSRRR